MPNLASRAVAIGLASTILLFPASLFAATNSRSGHFTMDQAKAGKKEFSGHCSGCHGGHLGGEVGPALVGSAFAKNLNYSDLSAEQLYHFISHHMPQHAPGTLKTKDYLEIFSYLLCANGFDAGKSALTEKTVENVKLLPLPEEGTSCN